MANRRTEHAAGHVKLDMNKRPRCQEERIALQDP
jgi:hypothetical protein